LATAADVADAELAVAAADCGVASRRRLVLAAGLGERRGPLTLPRPKPLWPLAGGRLIDHVPDRLAGAGVETAVVNVHYLPDLLEESLARRKGTKPAILVSDERNVLLDTGGGIAKALPQLGTDPFFVLNSDRLWTDGPTPALERLRRASPDD